MITYTLGVRTRISVEDCITIEGIHATELEVKNNIATVTCPCCGGDGEHQHGRGPYADTYPCDACAGKGHFPVNVNL
jgi:hypothetical protein